MARSEPELRIGQSLRIPTAELSFSFSRSGGPGGQNVNKLSTKVTLAFDALASPSLSDAQKRRLTETIPQRLGSGGVIRLSSQRFRTQAANRRAVVERLIELLHAALRPAKVRKRTRRPQAAEFRRLEQKRRTARRKAERRWRDAE